MFKRIRLKFLNILSILMILLNYMPITALSETATLPQIKVEAFDYHSQDGTGITLELSMKVTNESTEVLEKRLTINGSQIMGIKPKQNQTSTLTGVWLGTKVQNFSNNDINLNTSDSLVDIPDNQILIKAAPSTTEKVDFLVVVNSVSDVSQISAEIEEQKVPLGNLPQMSSSSSTEVSTSNQSTSESLEQTTLENGTNSSTTSNSQLNTSSTSSEKIPEVSEFKGTTTLPDPQEKVLDKISPKDISDLFDYYAPGDNFVKSALLTPDPITDPNNINLNVTFAAPSSVTAQMRPGDYYKFNLPEALQFNDTILPTIDLKDNNGNFLGKADIDTTTGTVTITLTNKEGNVPDSYDPNDFIPMDKAELNLSTIINKTVITQPGTHQINYPKEYKLPPQTVFIKPHTDTSISKLGSLDKQLNPTKVTWMVDVNKSLGTLENPTLEEHFPSQVTYQSAEVYPVVLDFSGNVVSVATTPLVEGVDYEIDANGNISFIGTITDAYRVKYVTSINDDVKPSQGGQTSPITNTATWNGLSASATVQGNYGKRLEKTNPTYTANTQTYNWTVKYNYGEKKIDTTSPIIDTYSNNMDLDLDSVHLFYMNINADGSVTKGTEVSKDDYTISQKLNSSPNKNQLSIQLKDGKNKNQAINIYYNTVVNQIISVDNPQNVKINNSVDQNGIPPVTPPAITQPKQQVVIKNTPTLDLNNKVATWTVEVNKNKYELNDAIFVDTIKYSELGYVSIPGYVENGQFISIIPQVKDTTTNTVLKGALTINGVAQPYPGLVSDPSQADYVVDIRQVPNPGNGAEMAYINFEIKFQNQYRKTSDSFRLSYSVRYNRYSNGAPVPSTLTYGNTIDMTWLDKDVGKRTSTSNHGFTTTTNEANQGLKSGEYNAATKEITWTILANYNNEGSQSFDIEDPILPNSLTGDESNSQTYVPGSLTIVRGRVNSSGKFIPATEFAYRGEQKDKSYIKYSEPTSSQNVLNLNFGGGNRGSIPGWDSEGPMVYQVQFKTSLKGKEVNQATFKNVATTDVLGIKNTLAASVSVKYGGQPLGKIGNFSNDKVNWSLTVNQAQSKLLNPVITDTPSNNQVIDSDTIVLYPTLVSKDGTITKDTKHPLKLDKDYHIQLTTDPENGQQSLVVSFVQQYQEEGQTQTQTIERPYILDYQSKPNLSSNSETVTNNASLKADGTEIINPDVTTSTIVKIPSGSGLAYGKKGKITIKKVNSDGSPLAGAQLELVRVYKNNNITPEEIYNVTTPSTGEVTLGNLVYTDSSTSGFKYILKELKAPPGYSVSPSLKAGIELTVNDQSSQSMVPLSIQNDSVTLNFYKKSESGTNISGGKFILEKLNDQGGKNQIGQPFSATQSGVALKNLEVGDYQIRELEVPSDEKGPLYLSNPDILKFSVKDTGEGVIKIYGADHPDQPITSLDMVNYQGKAQLIKENEYGEALSGAEFKLSWAPLNSNDFTEVNDPDKKPFLTDKEGKLLLSHLRPGKYKVQESKAPAGYYINPKEYTFTINGEADKAPDTIDLNSDHPLIDYKGMAQFTKTDEDGTTPLSGATFVLLDSSGNYINGKGEVVSEVGQAQRVTSDLLGHFKVSGLSPSMSYQLVEVQAPIGYVINDRPLTFTMPSSTLEEANGSIEDKNNQLIFQEDTPFLNYNWKVFWDKVGQENLSGEEQAPLGGAYYKLYKKDASGVFQDLTQSDNDYGQVEKEVDNQTTQVFESNPITGRVSAVKLTGGDYYYQEIAAPQGYILDTTKYYFSLPDDFEPENGNMINVSPTDDSDTPSGDTQNVKIHFENKASNKTALVNYKGAVEMKKVDENGTPLAGARFKVFTDDDKEVEQSGQALIVESKEDGTVYAEGLSPGSYYFQEVASPEEQYIINTQKVPFSIDTSATGKPKVKIIMEGSNEYELPNYKGTAQLTKIDAKTKKGLAGAEFEVYNGSNQKVSPDEALTSDEEGKVTIGNLSPGSYYFKEVKAPEGYLVNTTLINFVVDATAVGKPEMVTTQPDGNAIALENYKGQAELTKVNEQAKPIPGAIFELVDKDGNLVAGYDHLVSDNNGKVKATDLKPGSYRFIEKEAPSGYLLNSQTLPLFEIPDQAEGEPKIVAEDMNAEKLTAINYKGTAKLQKIVSINGKEVGLANAHFKIIDATSGDTVSGFEDLTSDAQGMVTADGLSPGKYQFVEISAAPGYVLNPTPSESFIIAESFEGKPTIVNVGKFINFKGTIHLEKVDEKNHPLAGAIFQIIDMSDKREKVVSGYENLISGSNGKVSATGLAPGEYQLREIKAPQGYIINCNPISFKIASQSVKQPTIDLGYFVNKKGSVMMRKVSENGRVLSGAVFQLKRINNGESIVFEKYKKVTSQRDGVVSAKALPPGNYEWVEISAPKGYTLSKISVKFTIPNESKNYKTQKLNDFINKKAKRSKAVLPRTSDSNMNNNLTVIGGFLLFISSLLMSKKHLK